MARKPECIDCGTTYDVRRWQLEYNTLSRLWTGSHAEQKRQDWCIAPIAHKQGATLVRRKSDLLGLNKYMGEV